MKINIPYINLTNRDEAFGAVKAQLTPDFLSKFKVKIDLQVDEADQRIKAKGKGFELDVLFLDDHLEGDLNLSFLLKPMKSKIMSTLESQLSKVL